MEPYPYHLDADDEADRVAIQEWCGHRAEQIVEELSKLPTDIGSYVLMIATGALICGTDNPESHYMAWGEKLREMIDANADLWQKPN